MKGNLIIEPCAGLGNRILALASASYVAGKNNMDFSVVWKKEDACYAAYSDIFAQDERFRVIEITEMSKRDIKDWIPTIAGGVTKHNLRKNRVFIPCEEIGGLTQNHYFDSIDAEQEYYI